MFDRNLPNWERAMRGVAGGLMVLCGFAGPGIASTPVGYIIAGVGMITALTGLAGFCPACAVAGRKTK